MLFHKAANEPPNFSGRTRIKLITQIDEGVPLLLVQSQNKLAILLFAFTVRLFGHAHLTLT